MKKAEFIKLWCDTVDQGRVRHFPDMRPSERAFSRLDDDKKANQMWRKYRAQWAAMNRDEVLTAIGVKKEVPSAS